jgi:glycosyltransferase involved in cell wall biosynthesis
MKFSVLMSVYYKETAENFDRAMRSIWDEQSVKPNEIILVQDGKLTQELYAAIAQWQQLDTVFKTVVLEQNLGTGDAKNAGLKQCSHDLVAIMDTDDICLTDRFQRQLQVFKEMEIDVCGGWISEFDVSEDRIASYRRVPETHQEIVAFAKKRMPVNHVSIMFKREVAIKSGGYQKMLWLEDYYLVVRMILNGARFYNIQEVLVNVRSSLDQLKRRSGFKYALSEINLQKIFFKLGFINHFEIVSGVMMRLAIRMMPKFLIGFLYKQIRKAK